MRRTCDLGEPEERAAGDSTLFGATVSTALSALSWIDGCCELWLTKSVLNTVTRLLETANNSMLVG